MRTTGATHRVREADFSRSSRGVGAPSRPVEGAYAKPGVPAGRRLSQRRRGSLGCGEERRCVGAL